MQQRWVGCRGIQHKNRSATDALLYITTNQQLHYRQFVSVFCTVGPDIN